ncbi:hypothetical protein SLEP1_g52329 [Rubroshorea leprosula]|uniref:Uncharacterized protein n=1 Tax=Rubroshorea leprosula TaxID=152421 RepID=A0AAV5M8L3_9ROSI|nr:hypothetical protein SLEP1_g52329 [Rubroshorea leprosula]
MNSPIMFILTGKCREHKTAALTTSLFNYGLIWGFSSEINSVSLMLQCISSVSG